MDLLKCKPKLYAFKEYPVWEEINKFSVQFSSVQFTHSVVSNSLQPHGLQHARLPCPSSTSGAYSNSYSLRWWCHPTMSSPSPPAFNLSQHKVFPNESVLHIRWLKYWNFSFSISPSNEYSGLISFRMDWLDLLTVQGTLKSLLQHHSSKASILWPSALFRNTGHWKFYWDNLYGRTKVSSTTRRAC